MIEAERDWSLSSALRALTDDDAERGAAPEVEAALLAEVSARAWRRRQRRAVAAVAVAAGLVLSVAVPTWWLTDRRLLTPPSGEAAEVATPFFPLAYGSVPAANPHIVRLEVPRVALAAFGVGPIGAGVVSRQDTVLADVLVGEDGLARAVRFVHAVDRQAVRE